MVDEIVVDPSERTWLYDYRSRPGAIGIAHSRSGYVERPTYCESLVAPDVVSTLAGGESIVRFALVDQWTNQVSDAVLEAA